MLMTVVKKLIPYYLSVFAESRVALRDRERLRVQRQTFLSDIHFLMRNLLRQTVELSIIFSMLLHSCIVRLKLLLVRNSSESESISYDFERCRQMIYLSFIKVL